ncbi:uncharacterized protein LOC5572408 [Aedes aegypti]|uniref:Uncharacterized protein n=1 Tax=Aedes aegypti TaxID=7159 RepID=A0A6I8TIG3_AEDAE|nr:uncharacterized protein LOC5572408 [Aedes aegypti]
MCDTDPPPCNAYNPEYPLESDDEYAGSGNPFFAASFENISDSEGLEAKNDDSDHPDPNPVPKVYTDLFCVKEYTREDLYPTELDPTCYPAWTLSPYWPVYVSNFMLNSFDELERNTQIATYFASKGLLSRMIYIWCKDEPYFKRHQKCTLVLDMLVYFTSKEDADRAIRCCDKTTYYGHRLNVMPGRIPLYFDPERTICFKMAKRAIHVTDTWVELTLRNLGIENIDTIVRHSDCEVFVEFGDVHSMRKAVSESKKWIPSRLTCPVRKQRFLEDDCKYDMMFLIQEDPSFLDMLPPEYALNDLLNGKLPPVVRDWDNWTRPKAFRPKVHETINQNRLKRKQQLIDNARARQEAKRKGLPVAPKGPNHGKKTKYEVLRQKQAILGIPRKTDWGRQNFTKLSEDLASMRMKLLTKGEVGTLAVRNKLFYAMLKQEKKLGGLVDRYHDLQCDALENGLTVAIIIAGENTRFPQYPTNVEKSDEQEPLDKLWPVYVGNFPVTDVEPKRRNQQVCDFFASKSYTVKMVYLDENDKFYNSYLKPVKLLDILVYFESKEVADKVIETYHGVMHRGSKLSVYPGRWNVYYYTSRTVYLKVDKDPIIAEQAIERVLLNTSPEGLHGIGRYPKRAYFSFWKPHQRRAAVGSGLNLVLIYKSRPKQRFIEQDVKPDLLRKILNDPDFLNSQPKGDDLKQLFVAESVPPEEGGEIVWVGNYLQRKQMNERIGRVLAEWEKLQ